MNCEDWKCGFCDSIERFGPNTPACRPIRSSRREHVRIHFIARLDFDSLRDI